MTPTESLTESAFAIDLLVTSTKSHHSQRGKQVTAEADCSWLLRGSVRPRTPDISGEARLFYVPAGREAQGSPVPLTDGMLYLAIEPTQREVTNPLPREQLCS